MKSNHTIPKELCDRVLSAAGAEWGILPVAIPGPSRSGNVPLARHATTAALAAYGFSVLAIGAALGNRAEATVSRSIRVNTELTDTDPEYRRRVLRMYRSLSIPHQLWTPAEPSKGPEHPQRIVLLRMLNETLQHAEALKHAIADFDEAVGATT